jgi:iron complex outermembrane receptor protein
MGVGDLASQGFSGASLRGFGSRATLVLLNGRRVSNHAFSGNAGIGVDLNVIPLSAIERVEVLKDGASAIYGSDAIAGVINFILRQDFRGGEFGIERSHVQAGGGEWGHETLAVGAGDAARDGYNVFAIVDHRRQQGLPAADRSYAAIGYRPDLGVDATTASSFPANIPVANGSLVNPAASGCTARTVFKQGGCFYDYVRDIDILPPSDNLSLLTRASWALPDGAGQVHGEWMWSRQRTRYVVAPTPVNRFGLVGNQPVVVPEGSPSAPSIAPCRSARG